MACKLALTFICFLVLAGVVWIVPKLHEQWPLYLISYLQAVGICLSPNWLLQGMQRMKLIAVSDYGGKIITVALIFLLVRHSSDYLMAAALQSGAFLIAAVFGLVVAANALRIRLVAPSLREMREYMIEAWPVFLSFASGNVMNSSNTMILGMMTTSEQVGFLNAASRLVVASRSLVNPLATAVYPHMSQLASRSPAEAIRFLKQKLFWTTAPFLLISLGMLLFSPVAVRILYGARFQESAALLRLMSPTPFVHSLSMCFGTYFMLAFGYEKAWSKVIVQALGVNFVLVAILMPFLLPARAIALTTSLTDIFVTVLCMRFFLRKTANLVPVTEQSSSR